jgi:hypothetical protein
MQVHPAPSHSVIVANNNDTAFADLPRSLTHGIRLDLDEYVACLVKKHEPKLVFTVDELQKEKTKHRILQVKYKPVDIDEQSAHADNAMYLAVFKGQVALMKMQWFSFEFCERPAGRTVDVYKFLFSEFVAGDVTCEVEQLQLPDVVEATWNSAYGSISTAKEKKPTGKGEGSSSSDNA